MKQVLLFSFLGISMLPLHKQFANIANNISAVNDPIVVEGKSKVLNIVSQAEPGNEKMLAVVFKTQEFCRAELKDFEFDAKFSVVSAAIYFSGANFRGVEKGMINSNSLKPIRSLMERCGPGSKVVFDNVKVVGPDKLVRPISGMSLLLH